MKFLLGSVMTVVCVGCTEPSVREPDVVGPFTGEVRRFVVDGYRLPTNASSARDLADDLNGDGVAENQAGMVLGTLAGQDTSNLHVADMIAAGKLESFVEIQSDDAANDDTVGVAWQVSAGAEPVVVGGRLASGAFRSNRTRFTEIPVTATLHIPAILDADPVVVDAIGFQVDLTPDGNGGFDAILRGGVPSTGLADAIVQPILQMVAADPRDHVPFMTELDRAPRDGILSASEILQSTIVRALLAPDVTLFGTEALSIGIGVHLSPCPSGNCARKAPAAPCFDRVRDGDESDVDCGGSCALACPASAACSAPDDCQTQTCDGAGRCTAPTCSDGVTDGFESDVDCGGLVCARCAAGKSCDRGEDCASFVCTGGRCM